MGKRPRASQPERLPRTTDEQLSVDLTRVLRYHADPEECTPKLLDGCGGLYPLPYLKSITGAERLLRYDDSAILKVVTNFVRRSGFHRFMGLVKDGVIWIGLVSDGETEHEFNLMYRDARSSELGASCQTGWGSSASG